ncbi:unnamed protein product [Clonostachys chloroleuca]|uniref:Zn(2)-C6 fungal-type domain-containing protein n=1 Tax=Clonostachys chloroleuca TaxID=1926264 RepID=A0AA35Q891_9HYPO|nr:unnamed protein product [Clonostachys chloroleuca]
MSAQDLSTVMSTPEANVSEFTPSIEMVATRRKRPRPADLHTETERVQQTRTAVACDACRISKTRCDATRPSCAKCQKRGRRCLYPDKDPSSVFEILGGKILKAIEDQGQLIANLSAQGGLSNNSTNRHPSGPHDIQFDETGDEIEAHSRKDVLSTPITASDDILKWNVFPADKPIRTFPASVFSAKMSPYSNEFLHPSPERILELRDIYLSKFEPLTPFVDNETFDDLVLEVLRDGLKDSVASCFVLSIFALAAIWGNYPEDERRSTPNAENGSPAHTVAVPEHRFKESSIYFAMAQSRMSYALQDDSLLGVSCYCLMGSWYWYNFEPIQGWKMFRTASMLWETYHQKQALDGSERSQQELSLEQRLFWTCMKAECEMRYELPNLPLCTLQDSQFSFQLPSFPSETPTSRLFVCHARDRRNCPPTAFYYFLAEISLRRLLNRARNAATKLSPNLDSSGARMVAEKFTQLEEQLQRWLECLPPCLYFNLPPDSLPSEAEPELVKLMRERYVEVRELLCRAFLYICIHDHATQLTIPQMRLYGAKASLGLRLNAYRIETEKPFYRHCGSWIACRVRFNHALCLLAAARAKNLDAESTKYIEIPINWRDYVIKVKDRLDTWSDQGGGIEQLSVTLSWLASQSF